MKQLPEVITRRSAPNKYDQAPYGTRCVVVDDEKTILEHYKQISKDEENPMWEKIELL
jgi:hypothetical protein